MHEAYSGFDYLIILEYLDIKIELVDRGHFVFLFHCTTAVVSAVVSAYRLLRIFQGPSGHGY